MSTGKRKALNEKQTVMIIGFNIRPIACLAKKLGLKVVAVDYWGDLDITNCADRLFTVLEQKPGKQIYSTFNESFSESLVDLAEQAADQCEKVDSILVGSGLDDRPDLWSRLGCIAPVLGNTPKKLETIRKPSKLFSVARRLSINCPRTEKVSSLREAVEIAENIGCPVVLKPISGSGGVRLRFGENIEEVKKYFREVAGDNEELYVQEYIRGVNASSSIIGDGHECAVVSVNEQLIGMEQLGAPTPFCYCGSIVPLKANKRTVERVREISYVLGKKLGLTGSNGFDFVIGSNEEPYLIEINPRFQATIECIQYVHGLNLVEEHIKACRGELPKNSREPKGFAVKMVVFAKNKGIIPDLSGFRYAFDIPHSGIIVDKGGAVCTVQLHSQSRELAVSKAQRRVSKIYKNLACAFY